MTTRTRTKPAAVHPSAIVDPNAKIGEGVEIGPFCVVGPDVTIGDGTKLLNNVTVVNRVTIGKKNTIASHAVIGGKPQDLKYRGEDTEAIIGDQNDIREFVTVNIGTAGGGGVTRIGNHCLLMAGCHIAHDCELGNNIVIANNVLMGGHVKIDDYVGISGHAGLHHFVTVGKHAFVGGFSGVNTDVPPFMLVSGIRNEVISINSVGLRRRGFSEDRLQALRDAHRLLWRSGLPRHEAIGLLEQRYPGHQDVKALIEFLRAIDGGKSGRAREALRSGGFPDPEEDASYDGQNPEPRSTP